MSALEGARRDLLGDGLLTVNVRTDRIDEASESGAELQRIWSSNIDAYPVAGRKRKSWTPWALQLLGRAEVFVGEGTDALKEAFSDHALIASLGLRSIVNVPLMDDCGDCFATFNVLTHRDKWEPRDVIAIRLLALLATPAVAREASKLRS
ncbi:GAF domain-containing protein [Variovorax sp. J22P240]|uniref:GAF domain-containing protein n=1 Tax=Variovorax sp. J22P240 TaxID=3053514 RepID=UPI00257694AE|nr:GAF domain-containing protein [Variovorax sp. J22P240]MDL9999640.1 GAF domain-containing protein [Variovorax sp. J22P240]